MSIEKSISGVTEFLRSNDELIDEISEAPTAGRDIINGLAERLDASSREAAALVEQLGRTEFAVSADSDVQAQQKQFLDEITEVSKKIRRFGDHPDILANLHAQRGALYLGLSNTFNDLVSNVITFTPDEVAELRVLLQEATLDAAQRQRWADVLEAAVQISKLSLRVATKLVA